MNYIVSKLSKEKSDGLKRVTKTKSIWITLILLKTPANCRKSIYAEYFTRLR